MKGLTAKEEEIMGFFWEKGPLFVKEMLAFYEDPKPHFNTLSTIVRGLEEKGFLAHYTFGNTYQYYPVVSEEEFRKGTLRNVISKYFLNCTRSGFFCLKTLKLYPNGSIMIDMNKIGNYIKEERKKAGLTQEEFAMRSGLGLRFVRELEQGKETVRMDKVNQALAMFGKEAVPGEKEE